jgi:hypothetical protein
MKACTRDEYFDEVQRAANHSDAIGAGSFHRDGEIYKVIINGEVRAMKFIPNSPIEEIQFWIAEGENK